MVLLLLCIPPSSPPLPLAFRLYSIKDFERTADAHFARRFATTAALPSRAVERVFWEELRSGSGRHLVEYASDVEGSAFSASPGDRLARSKWNLKVERRKGEGGNFSSSVAPATCTEPGDSLQLLCHIMHL